MNASTTTTSDDDDDDALLANLEDSLENDPTLAHHREARLQQLSTALKAAAQQRRSGHGTYTALRDEAQVLDITTTTDYVVVHFSKTDFHRCGIMDGHLAALAGVHLGTRFLKIDVEDAPFLVARLNVRVLPCVIAFVGGVSADRIVGFEGVGYSEDTFKTADLEKRLVVAGVLEEEKGAGHVGLSGTVNRSQEKQGTGGNGDDDDNHDDDEWD